MHWSWKLLLVDADVLESTLDDLTPSTPAVLLLASSGMISLVFILRWMMRFQREFTDFYVAENTKLRTRIDQLEAEVESKDQKVSGLYRELLRHERESQEKILVLEAKIAELERRQGP